MLFRSKKGNGKNSEGENTREADRLSKRASSIPTIPAKGSPPIKDAAAASSPASNDTPSPLAPEELKKHSDASKQFSATIGEIVGLMVRSPRHRNLKLIEIMRVVVPAVRSGQFSLATAQSKSRGHIAPVATVLWASVSAEVDRRISDNLLAPIRLVPKEWKSGDILWIVDTVGDNRMVAAVVGRLQETLWKGKQVKVRIADAQKQVQIRTIEPKSPTPLAH